VPVTLTIAQLKGGAGKTTTAAHVAHAQHEQGWRVLAVDADPQGSLYTWHAAAGFPFPAVQMPSARLHRDLPGIVGDRYDVVVVDTPGTEHGRAITLSAVRAASHVLVPCAPGLIEYERLRALRDLLDDAADLEVRPEVAVLLVRTVSRLSRSIYREQMTADGWRVLDVSVARLERFAQAFGGPVERAAATGYGDAVAELLQGTAMTSEDQR
jgi:chromosome partitioning protein